MKIGLNKGDNKIQTKGQRREEVSDMVMLVVNIHDISTGPTNHY